MSLGRPPKPTSLHLVEGTFRGDRHGERLAEPRPDGLPEVPAWLEGEALGHWQEVVPTLVATRVAKALDSHALAMMCTWWAEWRRLRDAPPETSGRVYLLGRAQREWSALASRFGLTPADRTRLAADAEKDTGAVDRLVV
ncbi:MAG: P27 family phage terminase small subunit [Lacipirellulaceae bacterium]